MTSTKDKSFLRILTDFPASPFSFLLISLMLVFYLAILKPLLIISSMLFSFFPSYDHFYIYQTSTLYFLQFVSSSSHSPPIYLVYILQIPRIKDTFTEKWMSLFKTIS